MIALLGSVLGFFTSVGPGIFKQIMTARQDKLDKAHELVMANAVSNDKRDEALISHVGTANVEIQKSAKYITGKSSQWVIDMAGTVRPLVTYCFFFEFFTLSLLMAFDVITVDQFHTVWSEEMVAIFATIMSFWFGQRLVSKWVG